MGYGTEESEIVTDEQRHSIWTTPPNTDYLPLKELGNLRYALNPDEVTAAKQAAAAEIEERVKAYQNPRRQRPHSGMLSALGDACMQGEAVEGFPRGRR